MRSTCQSIAKATGEQCKKKVFPGSKYCLYHIDKTSIITSTLLGAIMSLTIAGIWHHFFPTRELVELRQMRAAIEPLSSQLYPKRDLLDSIKELSKFAPKLIESNGKLKNEITELRSEIEKKDETIETIRKEVALARRGATTSYDFNGNRRETSRPGFMNIVNDNPESNEFLILEKFHKEHDWKALANYCEEIASKNPRWLTPFLYLGVSYANLGKKEKAIKNLQYVVDNAGDDPHYKDAKRLLELVKQKL